MYTIYSMCSLVVSVLDSPAVDPRSNPGSGSALLMSEKSQAVYYISSCHMLIDNRGVPRIWQGGGKNFFFRFGNLHVAKRHAAHGEAMRFARGVRGYGPPRKFFKMVQFVAFWRIF